MSPHRKIRDITDAFWPFVKSLAADDEDGAYAATFDSEGYRGMCVAVSSGCPLRIRAPETANDAPSIVFDDIDALLLRGANALANAFPAPGRTEELHACYRRIAAWAEEDDLARAFRAGATMRAAPS